jgi:hypothetical protein
LEFRQSNGRSEYVRYSLNPEHRNSNPKKSQWTIIEEDEVQCFKAAYDKGWKNEKDAWGLYFDVNDVSYLGKGENRSKKLFIAKFKNDVPHNVWRGYPADYQQKPQDIPDKDILNDWMANGVLKKAKVRKIMAGQPCNL